VEWVIVCALQLADSLAEPTQLILVQNWFEELKRLVPVDD
jgi:hypothetical protein